MELYWQIDLEIKAQMLAVTIRQLVFPLARLYGGFKTSFNSLRLTHILDSLLRLLL